VILNSSKNKETAHQFEEYMKSNPAADILSSYGFDVTSHNKRSLIGSRGCPILNASFAFWVGIWKLKLGILKLDLEF
jgi:hypothetical protein